MDATPTQLIDEVEFREVRRGYDPAEVDAFLDRIAAAMAKLHQQVTEATERAQAAEAKLAAAPTPAPAPAAEAPPAVDPAGTEQLQRTLVLAQRTADAAVKEAQEEAAAIVSQAKAAAAQTSQQARESSLAELRDLETVRNSLEADIALLQNHLDTHRQLLGGSVAQLQRWLDDPTALRVAAPEGLSGATVPAADPTAPVAEAAPVPEVSTGSSEPSVAVEPEPAPPVVVVAPVAEPEPALAEAPVDPPAPPEPVLAPDTASAPVDPAPTAPADPPQQRVDGPPPAAPVDELIDLGLPGVVISGTMAPDVIPEEAGSAGPPTESFDALAPAETDDNEDDAFLAELRKAMTDDEPLGPRDDDEANGRFPFDDRASHSSRPRFGRRR